MKKDSIYNPSGKADNTNRTFVPEFYQRYAEEMQEALDNNIPPRSVGEYQIKLQIRQLVGVLFSRSSNQNGEIYPFYIGRNTIGSDKSSDIYLRENTISPFHGILLARQHVDESGEESLSILISDNNSEYGIEVNGERLLSERIECKEGDRIVVGKNYEFKLTVFDAGQELKVSSNFELDEKESPVENVREESVRQDEPQRIIIRQENSLTKEESQDDPDFDFYKPSKQTGQDHYNNETIIL